MKGLFKIYLSECLEQKYFLLAKEIIMESEYVFSIEDKTEKILYLPWHMVRAIEVKPNEING